MITARENKSKASWRKQSKSEGYEDSPLSYLENDSNSEKSRDSIQLSMELKAKARKSMRQYKSQNYVLYVLETIHEVEHSVLK
jgi:hypothetical protein